MPLCLGVSFLKIICPINNQELERGRGGGGGGGGIGFLQQYGKSWSGGNHNFFVAIFVGQAAAGPSSRWTTSQTDIHTDIWTDIRHKTDKLE